MINIEDVKTLKLEPGQILLVQVDQIISNEQMYYIREKFETVAPVLKDRILIVGKGVTLSVIDTGLPRPSHPVINCSDGS